MNQQLQILSFCRQKLKGILFAAVQLLILLICHAFVWGDFHVVAGVIAILLQLVFSLRFSGWAAAVSYSLLYWLTGAGKATGGTAYLVWMLSYIGLVVLCLVIDFIWAARRKAPKPYF